MAEGGLEFGREPEAASECADGDRLFCPLSRRISDERRDPVSLPPGDDSTVRCWIMLRRGFLDRRRPVSETPGEASLGSR
jgi:hypothetical protein